MSKTLSQSYDEFMARMAHHRSHDPTPESAGEEQIPLIIGLLIGGGFPKEAAIVAYAAERNNPDRKVWPWSPTNGT